MRTKPERQIDDIFEDFLSEGQKCHLMNKLWKEGYRHSGHDAYKKAALVGILKTKEEVAA